MRGNDNKKGAFASNFALQFLERARKHVVGILPYFSLKSEGKELIQQIV
jgi:hypothetical protein